MRVTPAPQFPLGPCRRRRDGGMKQPPAAGRSCLCGRRYKPGGSMSFNPLTAVNSQHEFDAASRDSLLLELAAVLTGRERSLLPLSDVLRAAGMDGQVDRGE